MLDSGGLCLRYRATTKTPQTRPTTRNDDGDQILTLLWRFRPGLASFEYAPKCCGDPWTIHVLQCGTELCKGHSAEAKLLTTYRVDVRKMKLKKNLPKCDANYVNATVQNLLQARGIVDHLCPAVDRGDGWFSFDRLFRKDPLRKSNWEETGFHAFPLECLASIVKHGLLASSRDRPGCRFKVPGLYLMKKRTHSAASYSRFVADSAGIFFRFTMECLVDRNQLIPCKRRNQWLQPVGSWARVALWVQALPYKDIGPGECIMPVWIPLLEVHA